MRLAILLLVALPAMGATEVCRFAARDAENPFKRWLSSQDVTCVDAATPLELPPGQWNVFQRVEGTSISAPVTALPANFDMFPAATLIATLPEGRKGVVYAPRRAVAYPLTPRTTVPAGEELWLLVLDKSTPVAIFPVPALEPATERTVDARGRGITAVLTWLELPAQDQAAVKKAQGIDGPRVGTASVDADPLPPLHLLHGAFVLVRGLEAGDAQLEVGGRGWLPSRRSVKVGASSVTIAATPLIVRGAATVIARWAAELNLPELERSIGACRTTPADKDPQYEVTLSACGKECSPVRREVFGTRPEFGSFVAEGLLPGTYRVELRLGKLPPVFSDGSEVRPLEQRDLRVHAWYTQMFGSLTFGGEPLGKDATLEFPDGIGFAPAESEEYRAAVREPIDRDGKLEIATCDGSIRAVVLADRAARPHSRFDVDVPDNALRVNVIDTFTRMPLAGANVAAAVLSQVTRQPVLRRRLKTDGQGVAGMKYVPVRDVQLTVTLSGYEKNSEVPFAMPRSGEKTVDVELVPVRGGSGRILSPRPFEEATILWFSASHHLTESTELAEDGTFVFAHPHTPEETMVVVSLSHPLWTRYALPSDPRKPFEVRFPDAPSRDFHVLLRGAAARVRPEQVGLAIGGLRVPLLALRQHLALRDAKPLHFPAIAETAPIDILLNARMNETGANRRLPAGATEVVFE